VYHRVVTALGRSFAAAALVWAALLPLATYAASRTHLDAMTASFTVVVYAVGALVCHQLPARSFHVWGAQMPVCARCTGIYFGAALGAVIALARLAEVPWVRTRPQSIAVIAVVPAAATLVFEWTTGVTPSNAVRFASGLWLGGVLAALVVAATTLSKREVN